MDKLIELLSKPQQVQTVLQCITSYIIYIYPGIITIYWNNFLEAKSTKDTQALIIKSFSISYLYNIILRNVLKSSIETLQYNIVIIIVSILFPYISYKVKYSKILRTICEFVGIRTCLSGVPFELLKDSEEKYTCLKIYLNDNVSAYTGYMDKYEYEDGKERFIILTGYKKYIYINNEEKILVDNSADQYNQKVFIKYCEIKLIEKIAEDIANNEIYCDQ